MYTGNNPLVFSSSEESNISRYFRTSSPLDGKSRTCPAPSQRFGSSSYLSKIFVALLAILGISAGGLENKTFITQAEARQVNTPVKFSTLEVRGLRKQASKDAGAIEALKNIILNTGYSEGLRKETLMDLLKLYIFVPQVQSIFEEGFAAPVDHIVIYPNAVMRAAVLNTLLDLLNSNDELIIQNAPSLAIIMLNRLHDHDAPFVKKIVESLDSRRLYILLAKARVFYTSTFESLFNQFRKRIAQEHQDWGRFMNAEDPQYRYLADFILTLSEYRRLSWLLENDPMMISRVKQLLHESNNVVMLSNSFVSILKSKSQALLKFKPVIENMLIDSFGEIKEDAKIVLGIFIRIFRDDFSRTHRQKIEEMTKGLPSETDMSLKIPYHQLKKDNTITLAVAFQESAINYLGMLKELISGQDKRYPKVKGYKVENLGQTRGFIGEKTVRGTTLRIVAADTGTISSLVKKKQVHPTILSTRSHSYEFMISLEQILGENCSEPMLVVPGACGSYREITSSIKIEKYQHISFILTNTQDRGDKINLLLYFILENLGQGVVSWEDLRNAMRENINGIVEERIFPDDISQILPYLLLKYKERQGNPDASSSLPLRKSLTTIAEKNNLSLAASPLAHTDLVNSLLVTLNSASSSIAGNRPQSHSNRYLLGGWALAPPLAALVIWILFLPVIAFAKFAPFPIQNSLQSPSQIVSYALKQKNELWKDIAYALLTKEYNAPEVIAAEIAALDGMNAVKAVFLWKDIEEDYSCGFEAFEQGRFLEAAASFENILAKALGLPLIWLVLATTYFSLAENAADSADRGEIVQLYKQSIVYLSEIIQQGYALHISYKLRGVIFMRLGDLGGDSAYYRKAIADFEALIKIEPSSKEEAAPLLKDIREKLKAPEKPSSSPLKKEALVMSFSWVSRERQNAFSAASSAVDTAPLNTIYRRQPACIKRMQEHQVSFAGNAQRIIQNRPGYQEGRLEIAALLEQYFTHMRLIHRMRDPFYDNGNGSKIDFFLKPKNNYTLFSYVNLEEIFYPEEPFQGTGYPPYAPAYTYESLPTDILLSLREFVSASWEAPLYPLEGGNIDYIGMACIFSPQAEAVQYLIGVDYSDVWYLDLACGTAQERFADIFDITGLKQVVKANALAGDTDVGLVLGDSREVLIPDGIGPAFFEHIVVTAEIYSVIEEAMLRRSGCAIAGRHWRDVIFTEEAYLRLPSTIARANETRIILESIKRLKDSSSSPAASPPVFSVNDLLVTSNAASSLTARNRPRFVRKSFYLAGERMRIETLRRKDWQEAVDVHNETWEGRFSLGLEKIARIVKNNPSGQLEMKNQKKEIISVLLTASMYAENIDDIPASLIQLMNIKKNSGPKKDNCFIHYAVATRKDYRERRLGHVIATKLLKATKLLSKGMARLTYTPLTGYKSFQEKGITPLYYLMLAKPSFGSVLTHPKRTTLLTFEEYQKKINWDIDADRERLARLSPDEDITNEDIVKVRKAMYERLRARELKDRQAYFDYANPDGFTLRVYLQTIGKIPQEIAWEDYIEFKRLGGISLEKFVLTQKRGLLCVAANMHIKNGAIVVRIIEGGRERDLDAGEVAIITQYLNSPQILVIGNKILIRDPNVFTEQMYDTASPIFNEEYSASPLEQGGEIADTQVDICNAARYLAGALQELGYQDNPFYYVEKAVEIARNCSQEGSSFVLEIGCGDTEVAWEIARRGIGVIATDIFKTSSQKGNPNIYREFGLKWRKDTLKAQLSDLPNLTVLKAGAGLLRYLPDGLLDYILLVNPEKEVLHQVLGMLASGLAKKVKSAVLIKPFYDPRRISGEFPGFQSEPIGDEVFGVNLGRVAWRYPTLSNTIYKYYPKTSSSLLPGLSPSGASPVSPYFRFSNVSEEWQRVFRGWLNERLLNELLQDSVFSIADIKIIKISFIYANFIPKGSIGTGDVLEWLIGCYSRDAEKIRAKGAREQWRIYKAEAFGAYRVELQLRQGGVQGYFLCVKEEKKESARITGILKGAFAETQTAVKEERFYELSAGRKRQRTYTLMFFDWHPDLGRLYRFMRDKHRLAPAQSDADKAVSLNIQWSYALQKGEQQKLLKQMSVLLKETDCPEAQETIVRKLAEIIRWVPYWRKYAANILAKFSRKK
ncbi:MAG: hypothetical protein WC616_05600, partial [Candidatus Omnitrophota bacterium]